MFICYLYVFFEVSVQNFCPFKNWGINLFLRFKSSLYILHTKVFIRYAFDKCFVPVYGLSFHSFSCVFHRAEFLILMQSNINFSLSWIKLVVFDLLFSLNNMF